MKVTSEDSGRDRQGYLVMDRDRLIARKKTYLLLVGILGLAVLTRVLWTQIATSVDPILRASELHGDASGYHVLALNFLEGNGLTWDGTTPTSYRMPGYPAFLATIYWLSSTDLQAARLIQGIIGAFICLPVFATVRRLADETTALVAALGVALFPMLIYMSGWLYSETIFIFLLWVSVSTMLLAIVRKSSWLAILSGAIIGTAALFRPEVVIYPILLLLGGALVARRREVLRPALFALFTSAIVLVPWFVRNYSIHKEVVLLTTSSGSNFYAGNNPSSRGGSVWTFPLEGISEVESDRQLQRQAIEWIASNPLAFLELIPQKALKFFSPLSMEASSFGSQWWMLPINITYLVFLALAAFGAFKTWRTIAGICVLTVVLLYFITSLVFFGGTRVALPAAPGLIALASIALVPLLRSTYRWVVLRGAGISAGRQVMIE